MMNHLRWLVVLLALSITPSLSQAEWLRFRFVPVDPCGTTGQVPVGPEGAMGELKRGLGVRSFPYPHLVRPNQMVTFRHPNGRNITIPLRAPVGAARMEQFSDHIVYNYGDYTIDVRFLPEGGADVVYNNGPWRVLRFE